MQLIALLISTALIGLTIWWFFGKKESEQTAVTEHGRQQATVVVDGGYKPEVTVLQKDTPTDLIFLRKDTSSCLEEVIFPDLGLQQKLSLKQSNVISIPALRPGEYGYSCGMRMYHGKLVIK